MARQLAHTCHADRESRSRAFLAPLLIGSVLRVSRRRRRFSFKAVSVKRPSELFSRGRRVANEPSRRVVHVRILGDRGGGAPAKRAREQREKKKKEKGERRFARVSNYNKSPAPPCGGDIAAIATSAGVSEFTIGYVGNSNVCLSVLHAGNFAYLLL